MLSVELGDLKTMQNVVMKSCVHLTASDFVFILHFLPVSVYGGTQ